MSGRKQRLPVSLRLPGPWCDCRCSSRTDSLPQDVVLLLLQPLFARSLPPPAPVPSLLLLTILPLPLAAELSEQRQ